MVIHPVEPSRPPQYFGVTVDKKTTHTDVLKAAMRMVGHKGRAIGATTTSRLTCIWGKGCSDSLYSQGPRHIFCLPDDPSPPCKEGPQVICRAATPASNLNLSEAALKCKSDTCLNSWRFERPLRVLRLFAGFLEEYCRTIAMHLNITSFFAQSLQP